MSLASAVWTPWTTDNTLGPGLTTTNTVSITPSTVTIRPPEAPQMTAKEIEEIIELIENSRKAGEEAKSIQKKVQETIKKAKIAERPIITATDVKSFMLRNQGQISIRPGVNLSGKLMFEVVYSDPYRTTYSGRSGDVLFEYQVDETAAYQLVQAVNDSARTILTAREQALQREAVELRQKLDAVQMKLTAINDARSGLDNMEGQLDQANTRNEAIKRRINL